MSEKPAEWRRFFEVGGPQTARGGGGDSPPGSPRPLFSRPHNRNRASGFPVWRLVELRASGSRSSRSGSSKIRGSGSSPFVAFPTAFPELVDSRTRPETRRDPSGARLHGQVQREGALGSGRPGAGEGQRASGAQLLRTKLGAQRR